MKRNDTCFTKTPPTQGSRTVVRMEKIVFGNLKNATLLSKNM